MLFISGLLVVILVWTLPGFAADTPKEIGREEQFVAYDDGTVLDTKTKLMWASTSSKVTTWDNAVTYIANFKGGGYTDWRLPTKDELETLLDAWMKSPRGFLLTKYIDIQACCPWATGKKRKDPQDKYRVAFDFTTGGSYFTLRNNDSKSPALPVRDTKK